MAGLTRLELAASCVTGRRSNQLNYNPDSNVEYTITIGTGDIADNRPTGGIAAELRATFCHYLTGRY